MSMEVSKVYPETRCQGLSAPGITANYICKDEAMRWIFNHSVDCNLKQVLNNVHVCTSGGKHVPKCNSKGCFYFFSVAKIHPTGFVSKGKENLKENVESCGRLSFPAPLPGLCLPVGICLLPHSGGLPKPGAMGFKQAPDPMWAPRRKLGACWLCTSSASLTALNPVRNMSRWWNRHSGEQKHERVQRWPSAEAAPPPL